MRVGPGPVLVCLMGVGQERKVVVTVRDDVIGARVTAVTDEFGYGKGAAIGSYYVRGVLRGVNDDGTGLTLAARGAGLGADRGEVDEVVAGCHVLIYPLRPLPLAALIAVLDRVFPIVLSQPMH